MLIQFSVENFLSFKGRVVFSMIPGRGSLKKNHIAKGVNKINLLKASIVFGANASGKSNLIKAMQFGKTLVIKGFAANESILFENFKLDINSKNKPSRMEYEIQCNGKNFAYGFVFNKVKIVEEWLYEINKKSGDKKIFDRNSNDVFDLDPLFENNKIPQDGQNFLKVISKTTRDNQLFLNEIYSSKVKENVSGLDDLFAVIEWFTDTLSIVYPESKAKNLDFVLLKDNSFKQKFEEFLVYFGTGIDKVAFEDVDFKKLDIPEAVRDKVQQNLMVQVSDQPRTVLLEDGNKKSFFIIQQAEGRLDAKKLMTKHLCEGERYETFDPAKEESDGTRRLFDLIPLMVSLINGDKVFLVDELERSLHPNLVYDILDLFLDKCSNVNSQLILASHESSLLTQKLLRKDEIWFAVKDKVGATSLHSLEEYKVRFDKEICKNYLLGRFKGIPKIGVRSSLTALDNNVDAENGSDIKNMDELNTTNNINNGGENAP